MSQPSFVAIRTFNRPGYLQGLLHSLSQRKSDTSVCVLVFDDSRDASVAQRNQQIVESAQRRFAYKASYFGKTRQQKFISALADQLPEHSEAIHWLLAERPAGIFSGGRLLNLIMLALAGHRYTLFDDDYLPGRARHLGQGYSRELEFSSEPVRITLAHASISESRAAGQEFGPDPIDAHLEFLGHRLQHCLHPAAGESESLLDASKAGTAPPKLQLDQNSVILTTVNGQFGVPISPNGFYLFHQPSGPDGPAWADPVQYQVMRRGRAIWNVTTQPVIASRTGSTPSGIDNRQVMPPTLPLCKGEDTLFCAMVKCLHPNAAHLYLPWALEHSRQAKPWAYATFEKPQKLMLAKTFWRNAEHFAERASNISSIDGRLDFLADHWLRWAEQPYAQRYEEIRNSFLKGVRWRIRVMSKCLEQVPDNRLQVHRDLQRGLKRLRICEEMKNGLPELDDDPAIRSERQRVEWLANVARDYSLALACWSKLWSAARGMQVIN